MIIFKVSEKNILPEMYVKKKSDEASTSKTTQLGPFISNKFRHIKKEADAAAANSAKKIKISSSLIGKITNHLATRLKSMRFEFVYSTLLVYLIYKNFFELALKHFVYFIYDFSVYTQPEFLFVSIYGIFQSTILLINLIALKKNTSERSYLIQSTKYFGEHFLMLNIFGLVQLMFGMNVWDHRHKLLSRFYLELIKFILIDFFNLIVFIFLFLKTINNNK